MTFEEISTQIITPFGTLLAVVVALWASISANRSAAKRDVKNREVDAYERWVEQFFKLGQLSTENRTIRRTNLQKIKSNIEIYRAHLANAHSLELAGAFSTHASRILQLHEIAEFLYTNDPRRKQRFGSMQIHSRYEWSGDLWYDNYRSFIRDMSDTMSRVSTGEIKAREAVKIIKTQEFELSRRYPTSFTLIGDIEREIGTLGAL